MLVAIRIIERLLTQSKFHEQHVQYKNYPSVDKSALANRKDDDEEEGKKGLGFLRNKKTQEKKEQEEEKKVEEELKEGEVVIKQLFTFECDFTQGRQVTCIDINSKNPDLIAAGYGEYDIGVK